MAKELIGIGEGLLGGLLGTYVIGKTLGLSSKLPEEAQPTSPSGHPGRFVADKIGLEGKPHALFTKHSQKMYGAFWGGLLGLAARRLGAQRLGRILGLGLAAGAIVWAVGYIGWLPAAKLTPPIQRQGLKPAAMQLANHLAYGLSAALPIYGIEKLI